MYEAVALRNGRKMATFVQWAEGGCLYILEAWNLRIVRTHTKKIRSRNLIKRIKKCTGWVGGGVRSMANIWKSNFRHLLVFGFWNPKAKSCKNTYNEIDLGSCKSAARFSFWWDRGCGEVYGITQMFASRNYWYFASLVFVISKVRRAMHNGFHLRVRT